eukprot:scaffold3073_cov66-Cylindrotheca_fusiformis.AAC.12
MGYSSTRVICWGDSLTVEVGGGERKIGIILDCCCYQQELQDVNWDKNCKMSIGWWWWKKTTTTTIYYTTTRQKKSDDSLSHDPLTLVVV